MHRADVRTGLVVFKRLKVHPFLAWLWRVLQSAEATDKYMCESPKATSLGCTVTDCEVANVSVGTHLLDIVPEPASSCGISLAQGFRSVPPAEPAPEALRSLSLILLFLVLEPRSALESFTHLLVSTASSEPSSHSDGRSGSFGASGQFGVVLELAGSCTCGGVAAAASAVPRSWTVRSTPMATPVLDINSSISNLLFVDQARFRESS